MARPRRQQPRLERHGNWWTIVVRRDEFRDGKPVRIQKRVRIAPLDAGEGKARKLADDYLDPLNQETRGSATNFAHFVETDYMPEVEREMAITTYGRTRGVMDNYLLPSFGKLCLRDITPTMLRRYFHAIGRTKLSHESQDKIHDVLSSALRQAVVDELITKNPAENVRISRDRLGRKRTKPYLTPAQFEQLAAAIPEPYATMIFVAIYTGLRVSELVGLRWDDIHERAITIDERHCRGDWDVPKSETSNATIAVNRCVIERIHRLKLLTVSVRAGLAVRKYRVVKSDGPNDLVFQSVKDGRPMRDNNILTRFLKPAARALGLGFVNWRCLRTSHATWLSWPAPT